MTNISIEQNQYNKQESIVRLSYGLSTRFIGKLNANYFVTKRKREHILRKIDALGINKSLLENRKIFFTHILIEFTDGGHTERYETTREYILANGTAHRFGNFDEQIFLPRKDFNMKKVSEWKNRTVNYNLFSEAV